MSVKYYWTFLYQEWWGQSNPPLPPSTLLPFFVPLLVTTTSTTKHSVQCLECILLYTKISGDPLQWYESIPLYQADSEKWLCHHATQICNVFLQTFSRVLHNFTASVKPGLSPLPRGESPHQLTGSSRPELSLKIFPSSWRILLLAATALWAAVVPAQPPCCLETLKTFIILRRWPSWYKLSRIVASWSTLSFNTIFYISSRKY